ncbi:MAG: hypothetical protein NWF01_04005 [Candidatus Bathyarchaeota archaeon]|nr:hypothetical protein [Candidatus Bathyarchaeota archaeon]
MKKIVLSRLFFIASIVLLLAVALLLRRDYQDGWILEGLEIPFALFISSMLLSFYYEKNELRLVLIAVVSAVVFVLIPNFKYVWFQGVYLDQNVQYNLANTVLDTGRIAPLTATVSVDYTSSPLFHLLFSVFSIFLNVHVETAMKYVPSLLVPLYPLLTFCIVKKLHFFNNPSILKYALLVSCVPISMISYEVVGTTFGLVLSFVVLYLLVNLIQKSDRRYWILSVFFVVALATAHAVSSIILSMILLAILVLKLLPFLRIKPAIKIPVILTVVCVNFAWLMFPGISNLIDAIKSFVSGVPTGTTPSSERIPSTFYSLLDVNVFEAAKTFAAYYGYDLFLLLLVSLSLLIVFVKRKKINRVESFFMLIVGIVFFLLFIGVFFSFGGTRALAFGRLLAPFFAGGLIFFVSKKVRLLVPVILSVMLLLSAAQAFGCQPLISSANTLYPDIPSNVPLGYVNVVNSVYQRQVVHFACDHIITGRIASDDVSYYQMLGVADYNFRLLHVIRYYPLDPRADPEGYSFFIIHFQGKAGVFDEQAQYRTPAIINQAIGNNSVIYTNGESHILQHHR